MFWGLQAAGFFFPPFWCCVHSGRILFHFPAAQGGDEDKFKECGAAVETLTDERTQLAYGCGVMTFQCMLGSKWLVFKFMPNLLSFVHGRRKRSAYDSTLIRLRSKDGLGSSLAAPGPLDAAAAEASAASARRSRQNDRGRQLSRHPLRPSPRRASRSHRIQALRWSLRVLGALGGTLSIKELKELLSALGIDHEGCLEKA